MDCTTLQCAVPGLYDYDLAATVELLLSYEGTEDIALTTELYEIIFL